MYLCTTKYNENIAYREFSVFRVFAILKVRVAGWICKNDQKKYSDVVLYIYKHHFRVSSIYFVSKHIPYIPDHVIKILEISKTPYPVLDSEMDLGLVLEDCDQIECQEVFSRP